MLFTNQRKEENSEVLQVAYYLYFCQHVPHLGMAEHIHKGSGGFINLMAGGHP